MRTELRNVIEHVEYFNRIPWCSSLIIQSGYITSPTNSRHPKGTTEDSFFAETLQTDRTIRKCLTLNAPADDTLDPPIREVLTFFELGNGVNGFPNICHGGFVATLLDEEMGILLSVNQEYANRKSGRREELTSMTAYLNMRYLGPVKTPGIVLGRAKVERVEGRKIYIRGAIQDSQGNELAVAECLFIKAKKDPRAVL